MRTTMRVAAATLAVGLACSGPPPPESPATTRAGTASCPALPDRGADAFAKAESIERAVERGDIDKHDSYVRRLDLYRKSAVAGHRGGQAAFGRLSFGTMMTTNAPMPEERAEYVEAMQYLIIAAARGDERAAEFAPGFAGIAASFQVPSTLEMPLSELPREWIEQAIAAARRWLDCHGEDD